MTKKNSAVMRQSIVLVAVTAAATLAAQQAPNPRQQPGALVHIYAPEQHDLYDGHFVISANRIYMVGGLNDPEGWDHLDNEAKNVKPVSGTAEIDVNEIQNTGKFEARLKIPEGDLVLTMDKWNEFSPCQNGGIVAYIHEHGTDSGCGDNNWPKTVGFLAGWGFATARRCASTTLWRTRSCLPVKPIRRHSKLISIFAARSRIRRIDQID